MDTPEPCHGRRFAVRMAGAKPVSPEKTKTPRVVTRGDPGELQRAPGGA